MNTYQKRHWKFEIPVIPVRPLCKVSFQTTLNRSFCKKIADASGLMWRVAKLTFLRDETIQGILVYKGQLRFSLGKYIIFFWWGTILLNLRNRF